MVVITHRESRSSFRSRGSQKRGSRDWNTTYTWRRRNGRRRESLASLYEHAHNTRGAVSRARNDSADERSFLSASLSDSEQEEEKRESDRSGKLGAESLAGEW